MLSIVVLTALFAVSYAQTVTTDPTASGKVLSQPLQYAGYGIHQPQGLAAVEYLYSSDGTWRQYTGLKNIYGYYNVPDSTKQQLVNYANGNNPATCPDPNNNVLWDLAYNSNTASGASFEEHNGRGIGGTVRGQPFSQFWYDDNLLARFMSIAYGAPQPDGIYSHNARWQIIGLDSNGWPQPNGNYPDQRALRGLYYIATGSLSNALTQWSGILSYAGTNYDNNNQRYTYPGLGDAYYLGLFKILTDKLMDAGISGSDQGVLFQHSISIRSIILSEQQQANGVPIGWITSRSDSGSLINTETTAAQVLSLGAGARYSFEATSSPMIPVAGFFVRPYGALSAVVGLSPTGIMVYGPYINLPIGGYTVDFYMRSGKAQNGLNVHLDVNDANANQVLGINDVLQGQFLTGNRWGRYSINIDVQNTQNQLEFRVGWGGQANMDISAIRVR